MTQLIIQAEFHHLEGDTPEEAAANAYERVQEGSRHKQVVRFTDEIGEITDLILRICDLEQTKKRYFHKLEAGKPVLFHRIRISQLLKKIDKKKEYLKQLILFRLGYAEVAVEDYSDTPFRIMREDERYELCVAAGKAPSRNMFVFLMKGELLSEKVKIIKSITFTF